MSSEYNWHEILEGACDAAFRATAAHFDLCGSVLAKNATNGSLASIRQRATSNMAALVAASWVTGDNDVWDLPECRQFTDKIDQCAKWSGYINPDGNLDQHWVNSLQRDATAILTSKEGARMFKRALRIPDDVLTKACMRTGAWSKENVEFFNKLA
jgi:hypothetical protein